MAGSIIGSRIDMHWDPNWDREVLASLEAKRACEHAAELGVQAAKRLAPVASGDYQASIHAVVETSAGLWHAAVAASDFKTNWIERGAKSPTYTTPAQHVLQRGVEETGIRVTSSS